MIFSRWQVLSALSAALRRKTRPSRFVRSRARLEIETLEERSLLAVNLGTNFAGIQFDSNRVFASNPPDPVAAVGPAHVVEGVNRQVAFLDKGAGAVLYQDHTATFFSTVITNEPGDIVTDPKVVYDELSGRFIITVMQLNFNNQTDNLLLAVSDDSDPTNGVLDPHGVWEMHKIDLTEGGTGWGDFPQVGYDADGIYISTNQFKWVGAFPFDHARLITIDKSSVLDHDNDTFVKYNVDRLPPEFDLQPAIMHGAASGAPMYFVTSQVPGRSSGGGGFVTIMKMTDKLSDNPTIVETKVLVPSYNHPRAVAQKDGEDLSAGDARILSVAWRGGRLVAAHTEQADQLPRARWYEFSTTGATPTLSQVGEINQGPGVGTFMPSIEIAPNGDLGMTFLQSSSTTYLSTYITGQKAGGPSGVMQTPVLVKAGVAPLRMFRGGAEVGGPLRTGDYSSVAIDPVDGSFWAANEFVVEAIIIPIPRGENWGTWIANFTLTAAVSATEAEIEAAFFASIDWSSAAASLKKSA